jgi:uncharacterized protein (DUF1697 family)
MHKYISILRGINVSGQKIIKMADLKFHYESLGLKCVHTYIQSGNVVFCSTTNNANKLRESIELKIKKEYNFSVPVMIITQQKLKTIISNNPFNAAKIDLSKLSITFLNSIPEHTLVKNIDNYKSDHEEFVISEDVIYLYCPNGFGKTKLTNNLFENKLKVTATSRNWRTTNKISEMIKELDCRNDTT